MAHKGRYSSVTKPEIFRSATHCGAVDPEHPELTCYKALGHPYNWHEAESLDGGTVHTWITPHTVRQLPAGIKDKRSTSELPSQEVH